MTHKDSTADNEFWIKPASTASELSLVQRLREDIYRETGKSALADRYRHELDSYSTSMLVGRNGHVIGTFSICNLRTNKHARRHLGESWNWEEGKLKNSLYVYFLGLQVEERTASALKFVFQEIFKYLVKQGLEEIYIVADARLARRYRLIGMQSIGRQIPSSFPKSGMLTVMKTKQIFFGVYGLHADPIRWNWYLRTPTSELMSAGLLPKSWAYKTVFFCYSLFQPVALFIELIVFCYLRKNKSTYAARRPHVRAV